ncbi:MAG TPA: AMP-binding protein [Vineibacter sp.]|nr:AMP-binding protein [Vineibacter sp.]
MGEPVSQSEIISAVLASHARRDPEAPALQCDGIAPLTFGALDRHIRLIGDQLRASGVGPSSRVGIALPRGPEAAVASLAACCVSTMLPINPNLSMTDLASELAILRPDVLILPGDAEIPAWTDSIRETSALFQISRTGASFDDVVLRQLSPNRRPRPDAPLNADSVAVIFRTSGTTGVAKRVPVTHGNLIEMARKMEAWLGLTPADRSACILPIYYNAGFKATLLVPLLIGCSVVMPATTNPTEFDRWVMDARPTWLTAAPAFLISVLEKMRTLPAGQLQHSLRFVLSTASYISEAVRSELETVLGVPVREFYGLAEAGMMTAPSLAPGDVRPGTVGRIPPGELAIRGDDGAFLPAGQVGQVILRGPSIMPGYLTDIEGVPSGLQDGWLVTGDVGKVDTDGFLTVVGRTKEIINRGGEKISPYDVEKALLLHPAVREAAAFAVPHPRLGENVAAAVTLKPGTATTSSELLDFLYDRLAPFQMPRHIAVLQSLPLGVTGKISRPQLSAAWADQSRRIEPPVEPLQVLIAEVWYRLLKRTDISIDDDFFEIGGDSLLATDMLLELEEITRRSVSMADIRAELSIRRLAVALVGDARVEGELITRLRDGDGPPLFLFHGDYNGLGLYALRLVELLRGDAPVFLVHSNVDKASGGATIEEMARSYLTELQSARPEGSFRLAGFCHGGLTAWAVAHELESIGRDVESVILIDSYSVNAHASIRFIARALSAFSGIAPRSIGDKVRQSGMPIVWTLSRSVLNKELAFFPRLLRRVRSRHFSAMAPGWAGTLQSAYFNAMAKYLPPRIGADVHCLLSEEMAPKREYASHAWKPLARSVRYEPLTGDHATCITRHVGELATKINNFLAAYEAR